MCLALEFPPGRLQEGSGALIKAAFAGQECGLLRPGVTEELGVRSAEPLLTWPVGWGTGLSGSCAWLSLGIFPSLLPCLPDLLYRHSRPNTGNNTVSSQTRPHPVCPLQHPPPRFSPLAHLHSQALLGVPPREASPWSALFRGSIREITLITRLLPRSGPKLQGEEQN